MGRFQRKYGCNDAFFSAIDTEAKAYWLGFLAADGCVRGNRLQICLSSRDRQHLVHLASHLGTDVPIRDYFIGGVHRSEFRVTSRQLVSDLATHGVVPRKSLILKWPEHLSPESLRHYLRGYMDGDGGFYISRSTRQPSHRPFLTFSIAGTESFCRSARDYLVSNAAVAQRKLRQQGKLWILSYERVSAGRIHDFLYYDATVYLPRKKAENPGTDYITVDAQRLRILRQNRGLTQTDLIKKSGLSQQTVFRLESGWVRQDRALSQPRGVHISTLRKLAKALSVGPSELTA